MVTEIREIVERKEIQIQSSTRCRIYKVPHLLRNWKEEAYTPQVVSIGPFHCKDERLKATEEHKERYPSLELINDWTEVVIRNIMALEQTRYIENAYFTDYFLFMDSLINTREDVNLLCDKILFS